MATINPREYTEDFKKSMDFVFINEGGYSNHPLDSGKATNFGITAATLKTANGYGLCSKTSVKELTKTDVLAIYYGLYWKPSEAYTLPYPLCTILFDTAVNHGVKTSVKILQRALNRFLNVKLITDGLYGNKTRSAIKLLLNNKSAISVIGNAFLDERIKVYDNIVAKNPSQKIFYKGWMNRVTRNRNLLKSK